MRLVGTHFSNFSKLAFYLFENVEKINIRGYNFSASASIPADSGVRGAGNQRRRQGNQVDELKYKIAGLTCQLLQPEE